jgi:hypothetical protein
MKQLEFVKTPDGVYCEGRSKGKPLPNVPKAFSFRSQIITPDLPLPYAAVSGSITDIRVGRVWANTDQIYILMVFR